MQPREATFDMPGGQTHLIFKADKEKFYKQQTCALGFCENNRMLQNALSQLVSALLVAYSYRILIKHTGIQCVPGKTCTKLS